MRVMASGHSNGVQFGMKKSKKQIQTYQFAHSSTSSNISSGFKLFDMAAIKNIPKEELAKPIYTADFAGSMKSDYNMQKLKEIESNYGYVTPVDVINHDFLTLSNDKEITIKALNDKGIFSAEEEAKNKKIIINQVLQEASKKDWTENIIQLLNKNAEFKEMPKSHPLRNAIVKEIMSASISLSNTAKGSQGSSGTSLEELKKQLTTTLSSSSSSKDGTNLLEQAVGVAKETTVSVMNFVLGKFVDSHKRITQGKK